MRHCIPVAVTIVGVPAVDSSSIERADAFVHSFDMIPRPVRLEDGFLGIPVTEPMLVWTPVRAVCIHIVERAGLRISIQAT